MGIFFVTHKRSLKTNAADKKAILPVEETYRPISSFIVEFDKPQAIIFLASQGLLKRILQKIGCFLWDRGGR